MTPFDGREVVPLERYFMGGENSIRGFQFRSIYVTDEVTGLPVLQDGYFKGGRQVPPDERRAPGAGRRTVPGDRSSPTAATSTTTTRASTSPACATRPAASCASSCRSSARRSDSSILRTWIRSRWTGSRASNSASVQLSRHKGAGSCQRISAGERPQWLDASSWRWRSSPCCRRRPRSRRPARSRSSTCSAW